MSEETRATVQQIENRIAKLVPIGGSAPAARIKEQLLRVGYAESAIMAAIKVSGPLGCGEGLKRAGACPAGGAV
jgi:hypothetical protein